MNSKIYTGDPINTLNSLIVKTLRLTMGELNNLINTGYSNRYHEPVNKAYKKDGTKRRVFCPDQQTRTFQRRINNTIFKQNVLWPKYVYGSIPNSIDSSIENRDYIKCAEQHCEAKSLLKIDVSDFFDNIHRTHVYSLFNGCFGFDEEVSETLCEICCYGDSLVQGALTSSYIANLVFFDLEEQLVHRLNKKNLIYTRFIDDITISSKVSNYNFTNSKKLVEAMLLEKDLPINNDKTEIKYSSMEPLLVHGLRVEFKQPRLPSKEVANIKASIHSLCQSAKEKKYRKSRGYRKEYNRCMGRTNKLARVGHIKHKEFVSKLKEVKPLPSAVDLKHAYLTIKRLDTDFSQKSRTHWYRKRYNRLVYLNNLIKLLYPKHSKLIKTELARLMPPKIDEVINDHT